MKKIFSIALVLFSATLFAQPTLTHTIVPAIGNTVQTFQSDTNFTEGPSGANQTWDFSSFTNTGNYSSVYVNPSTTSYIDSISGSNLAATTPGSTSYFNSTNSVLELLGLGTTAYVVIYSDPSTFFSFPLTYNSSSSDNNAGHYVYGGGTIYNTRTGTTQLDGDAYGTVITPMGTFTNVLRVKFVQQTTDVTSFSTSHSTVTSYSWYSPSYNNAIAQINYTVGDVGGSPYSFKTVNYGNITPSAIYNINNLSEDFFIADLNNNEYNLQLRNGGNIKSVQIYDVQGRMISDFKCNSENVLIDLKDYSEGLYIVRLLDSNNQFYQTKLLH